MRIGIICPYSLTIPGGVQSQVLGLARQLRTLGQHTRVLGPCDGPPPDASVIPLGDSLPTAANGSIAPIAPDVPCALRTIQALRDGEFDLLHLHEPMAPGPTITALFMSNTPMVGTFHAAGGSLAYDLLNRPIRWLSGRLNHRFAVSNDAAEMAQTSLGHEYEILFNGVETDQCEKATPWPTKGPTIFFVGRHEPRKGLSVLLGAMNELPSDVRLWIASDGPETQELKMRFAGDPRIEWLGRISEKEKFSRMKGADIFCAPSLRGESFGIVLLEGMACDTVVVASDIPGYSKVAEEGKHAVLVPPDDSHSLATAIEKILGDPSRQEELRQNGKKRALEFSMESLARRYLDSYQEVLRTL